MPVICRLPGGSKGSGESSSDLQLNIFTQPDAPETKDGIWVQRSNTHKKIVVDNLISASGEWTDMSKIPFTTMKNMLSPVLYNSNIVMFDSSNNLWSFNGSTWTKIGDDSVYVTGVLCVLNNTLYCISDWAQLDSTGNNWGPALFKWTGTAWSKIVNIPISDTDILFLCSCTVMNGYMYILKQVTNTSTYVTTTQLLRSSGSSFTTVATNSYAIDPQSGNGVSLNNKLYWLGEYYDSNNSSTNVSKCMITSTGSALSLPSSNNTPFWSSAQWRAAVFDSIIHAFVKVASNDYEHYTFDGSTWTKLFDMNNLGWMYLCAFNARLYAFSNPGTNSMYYSKTHDKYPEHTLILQIADSHDGPYETALVNTSSLVTNGRFVTKFNDVFFVGESGLETADPIYYGDGSKWVKFKN